MKPSLIDAWVPNADWCYRTLLEEARWENRDAPRDECFMAPERLEYTYSNRTYVSGPMHPIVQGIMDRLNTEGATQYNVCFLNYYVDHQQHLGWHADDSPMMDLDHPIAVISFGAPRQIWVKEKEAKGVVPDQDRYLLGNGSLFVMPAGFQRHYQHRIPKHDRPCGGRISLTYRHYVPVAP